MKCIRKSSFTLLEILVSLSLISFLLFFFFGHLKTSVKVKNSIAQAQKIVYTRSYFQQRISDLFSKIEKALPTLKEKGEKAFFTEDSDSGKELNFAYNAGIDPEIDFSGVLKAKLYLSKEGELTLDTFSSNEEDTRVRKEILFNNVVRYRAEFYAMPKPFDKDKNKIALSYVKKTKWEENTNILPAIVKIYISYRSEKDNTLQQVCYSFFPNSKIKEITYES